MAQYIDKDALVAEIERLKADAFQKQSQCKRSGLEKILHQVGAYNKILSFLDTLEVKEVDLGKAIDFAMPSKYCWSGDGKAVYTKKQMRNFAKYFFELGIKAQREE